MRIDQHDYGRAMRLPSASRSRSRTKDFPGPQAGWQGNPLEGPGTVLDCFMDGLAISPCLPCSISEWEVPFLSKEPSGELAGVQGYHRCLKGVGIFVQDPLLPGVDAAPQPGSAVSLSAGRSRRFAFPHAMSLKNFRMEIVLSYRYWPSGF